MEHRDVEQRRGHQHDVVGRGQLLAEQWHRPARSQTGGGVVEEVDLREPDDGSMRDRHRFGASGGPAGEDQLGRVVLVDVRELRALAGVADDRVAQRFDIECGGVDPCGRGDLESFGVADQELRFGDRCGMGRLVGGPPTVEGGRDRPDGDRGPVGDHPFPAVGAVDGDSVAGFDRPVALQVSGDGIHVREMLAVVEAGVAVDEVGAAPEPRRGFEQVARRPGAMAEHRHGVPADRLIGRPRRPIPER